MTNIKNLEMKIENMMIDYLSEKKQDKERLISEIINLNSQYQTLTGKDYVLEFYQQVFK